MKKKRYRGRPIQSNKIKVKATPREQIDVEKLTQALVYMAKSLAENNTGFSQSENQ